jgi:hypothetical protein
MGRVVTVSDGAGWSVTVSNWGVAQTSRHPNLHILETVWPRLYGVHVVARIAMTRKLLCPTIMSAPMKARLMVV